MAYSVNALIDLINNTNDGSYLHISEYNGSSTTHNPCNDVTYGTGLFGWKWCHAEMGGTRLNVGQFRTKLNAAKDAGYGATECRADDGTTHEILSVVANGGGSPVYLWITEQP